jgi:hypothetical protein
MSGMLWTLAVVAAAAGAPLAVSPDAVALEIDIGTGQFEWDWDQGDAEPVEQFVMRCGGAPDTYAIEQIYPDPLARAGLVRDLIADPGIYYCRVYAENAGGISPGSNEITFTAVWPPPPPPGPTKPGKRKGHTR